MKALVYKGPRDVQIMNVPDAKIEKVDRVKVVSHELPLSQAPEAYKNFDERNDGWTKVVLKLAA
jgi:threonine dehydrogenase-like Zn-dependent dehydrogenase